VKDSLERREPDSTNAAVPIPVVRPFAVCVRRLPLSVGLAPQLLVIVPGHHPYNLSSCALSAASKRIARAFAFVDRIDDNPPDGESRRSKEMRKSRSMTGSQGSLEGMASGSQRGCCTNRAFA
jgi:hypothetical protein